MGSATQPGRSPDANARRRPEHLGRLILIAVVLIVLVAFILGNSQQVKVSFVFMHGRYSLIWVLLVTNLLGFAAGYLVHGRLGAVKGRGKRKG